MQIDFLSYLLSRQREICSFLLTLKEWQLSLFKIDDEVDLDKLSIYLSHEEKSISELDFFLKQESDYRKNGFELHFDEEGTFKQEISNLLSLIEKINGEIELSCRQSQDYFSRQIENSQIFKKQRIQSLFYSSTPSIVDIYC